MNYKQVKNQHDELIRWVEQNAKFVKQIRMKRYYELNGVGFSINLMDNLLPDQTIELIKSAANTTKVEEENLQEQQEVSPSNEVKKRTRVKNDS